eukprot:scaffold49791_cov19-Tisochrysis_lutea.AAC.1
MSTFWVGGSGRTLPQPLSRAPTKERGLNFARSCYSAPLKSCTILHTHHYLKVLKPRNPVLSDME